ncbi:unnamed protein product [Linum tenue]|uniref:Uncharacterized protein n=1 Tax=Linum tenue TaxID=586396 RepID=A0AAV0HXJ4_9ROSI|nr:unnamed protein product [Linum tenue]
MRPPQLPPPEEPLCFLRLPRRSPEKMFIFLSLPLMGKSILYVSLHLSNFVFDQFSVR